MPQDAVTPAAARAAIARLNPLLNAVISVDPTAAGGVGPLEGRPVLVKDCIDIAGQRTSNGATLRPDHIASEDAEVVRRLRHAGAVLVGKAHLAEFCFGATGANAHYGDARNPWDPARITGGSSSGSAAAVAAGLVDMSIGTDTGGSVRVPAALCGVVGLRPTFGRVSNRGVLDLSLICDTVGPIGRSVSDAALLFDAIAGYDPADPVSQPFTGAALATLEAGVAGLRIGVPTAFFFDDVDADIVAAVHRTADALAAAGAVLMDVPIPDAAALATHNAFRFVLADVADARRADMRDHAEQLGEQVRRRIALGEAVSGPDYAGCIRALWRWKRDLRAIFAERCDVLLTPTTPITAPLWSEAQDMVETTRRIARFAYDVGAAGVPALSVPVGLDRLGLPIGAQLVGPWGADALLFRVARQIEAARGAMPLPAIHSNN